MQTATAIAAIITPVITGLTAVVRKVFNVADRFVPGVSVVLGLAGGLILVELSIFGGLVGIISGLAATGLWEFGKNTVGLGK